MSEETFTDPDDPDDGWVDVRMIDPQEGEWDIDAVIIDGQVEYVDLRIRPELLADFVDCLIDDVDGARAGRLLSTLADRQDVDLGNDETT